MRQVDPELSHLRSFMLEKLHSLLITDVENLVQPLVVSSFSIFAFLGKLSFITYYFPYKTSLVAFYTHFCFFCRSLILLLLPSGSHPNTHPT
jgi:hypothetical protein